MERACSREVRSFVLSVCNEGIMICLYPLGGKVFIETPRTNNHPLIQWLIVESLFPRETYRSVNPDFYLTEESIFPCFP